MAFTTRLAKHAGDTGVAGAGLIDRLGGHVAVLHRRARLAEPVLGTAEETVIVYLIRELENAACAQGLGYLKFLTDQVVVAVDPNEDADRGLQRLADFAVAAQGICERLFVEQRTPLVFRIGIDMGPVIGSVVGRERRAFNLWGEAVQMAGSMARTGLPGVIQVTETVYQALNGQYLFQLRGHHYLEGVGEFSTYLMSGRSLNRPPARIPQPATGRAAAVFARLGDRFRTQDPVDAAVRRRPVGDLRARSRSGQLAPDHARRVHAVFLPCRGACHTRGGGGRTAGRYRAGACRSCTG